MMDVGLQILLDKPKGLSPQDWLVGGCHSLSPRRRTFRSVDHLKQFNQLAVMYLAKASGATLPPVTIATILPVG